MSCQHGQRRSHIEPFALSKKCLVQLAVLCFCDRADIDNLEDKSHSQRTNKRIFCVGGSGLVVPVDAPAFQSAAVSIAAASLAGGGTRLCIIARPLL